MCVLQAVRDACAERIHMYVCTYVHADYVHVRMYVRIHRLHVHMCTYVLSNYVPSLVSTISVCMYLISLQFCVPD